MTGPACWLSPPFRRVKMTLEDEDDAEDDRDITVAPHIVDLSEVAQRAKANARNGASVSVEDAWEYVGPLEFLRG